MSAAVGITAASRWDIELPAPGFDEQLGDDELLRVVTKVAGWLARHTEEGDSLLAQIGQYVCLLDDEAC